MRISLLALLLTFGCAPEIEEGYYACATSADCPGGWSCRSDLRCWQEPGQERDGGGVDAGESDAGESDAGGLDAGGLDAGGSDAGNDAGTDACVPAPVDVDLLVLVDNSASMTEEQAELARTFPQLIEGLITGDIDGDLIADFAPIDSLHIGILSSDMGTGGHTVPTCMSPMHGDDGVLIGAPRAPGCTGAHTPPFLDYVPPGGLSRVSDDFSCLARLGTGGCGFEQQLDAVLKAVTPSTSTVRFFDNTVGHGDRANAGFLREGSVLVTLLVTDEEDCSASDPDIFQRDSVTYPADLNLRCTTYADTALFPVSRYVDGLLALRPDPSQLVFAALVGIPADLNGRSSSAILADDRMSYRPDPSAPTRLMPACTLGSNHASPGRRYAEVAEGLDAAGAQVLVRSICQSEFDDTVEALLRTMAPSLDARCL